VGERADVVIIGSGILGLSAGFHLLLRDRSLRVVIIEREISAGMGSTGKATGGIRHQFAVKPLVYLSRHSIDEYRRFRDVTGVDAEFEAIGYLLLATTERSTTTLTTVGNQLHEFGVEFESLSAKQINERWPYLSMDAVRIAIFTPGDGHADPHSAVTGYSKAFRALNGRVLFGENALKINVASGTVTGVQTIKGTIETPIIVNAAGVRAAEVAGFSDLSFRSVHFGGRLPWSARLI
jgi:sarcosine oxidase subunit beta